MNLTMELCQMRNKITWIHHELATMFMKVGGATFGFDAPVFAGYVALLNRRKPGGSLSFVACYHKGLPW